MAGLLHLLQSQNLGRRQGDRHRPAYYTHPAVRRGVAALVRMRRASGTTSRPPIINRRQMLRAQDVLTCPRSELECATTSFTALSTIPAKQCFSERDYMGASGAY